MQKKHIGAISEIEVFDCASRKDIDRCADILKSIALYVGNNYGKNADLIKYVVEELEDPDLEDYKPKDIDTADQRDPLKMFVWKEEMKNIWKKRRANNRKKRLYTLLWGQCSKDLQNEIMAMNSYESMKQEQNPITLINLIKGVTYSFRDQKYLPGNVWKAYKMLFNTTQKEDEDLKVYYERFKNQIEVIENYVGDITILDFMFDQDEDYAGLKKQDKDKMENINAAKERCKEKLTAYGFLANIDKKRYGNLLEDLDNSYIFGDNKYPMTPQKAYEYALNYKHFKPKENKQNQSRRDGMSFATQSKGRNNNNNNNNKPRRCFGNRCYGNCDNKDCTAPGLANKNNNKSNAHATVQQDKEKNAGEKKDKEKMLEKRKIITRVKPDNL